jgi:predicted 2-oxoglutarate/Fe(II)-dependent dioxygenase YbiX/peroxiredoxin
MRSVLLSIGEPAPWFSARSTVNPQFHFDTVAGRYLILCFFQSAARSDSRRILDDLVQNRAYFDGKNVLFIGVSVDPEDEQLARLPEPGPGILYFWDFDQHVSGLFGAVGREPSATGPHGSYRAHTLVLDTRLRTLVVLPFDENPQTHVSRLLELLARLPPIGPPTPAAVQAPVLVVPRIFEQEFCRTLIRYYDERGGQESGFMRDVDGKTVAVMDYGHKRRRDQEITDMQLRKACMVRIHDRQVPEIRKAFQFQATRIERYIVACYESETAGHFRAHRDDTTKGTAHRRFAVSLNLNTGEYEGGNLRFPEFGSHIHCPPAGGAVVFSCSLLHEATPVTRGRRYAFLPFLYDEAAAKIRQENRRFLGGTAAPQAPPGGEQEA